MFKESFYIQLDITIFYYSTQIKLIRGSLIMLWFERISSNDISFVQNFFVTSKAMSILWSPSNRISGSTIGTNLLSCKIMVALSASTNTSKWLNAHCDCDILTLNWEKAALRAIPHAASFNSQCRWGHWKLEQVLTWGHKQRPFSLKKCDMIWTLTLVYFGRCYFVVFLCLLLFISCQFIIFIVANFCIQFFGYSSRKK